MSTPKILFLDIETAPNTAYVWGLWKQNVSISQIVDSSSVLCWAAKWKDDEEVLFDSVHKSSRKRMLQRIHKLLDTCDAVVHYNGTRFDIPTLNKEFLEVGLAPPASYKQIDLLKTSRKMFRFPSNKLDYVAKALGLGSKTKHEGFELWVKCMNKDKDAWEKMEEYNKQDVLLLEKVHEKFTPWISPTINYGLFLDGRVCARCGSDSLKKRGYAITSVGRYQRYQCSSCGGWSSDRKSLGTSELKEV